MRLRIFARRTQVMKRSFEKKNGLYPEYIINGVKESLKQAQEGKLTPYTGIKDMIDIVCAQPVNLTSKK